MTRTSERIERLILYLAIFILSISSRLLDPLPNRPAFLDYYSIFIHCSGILTMFYAILCLYYRGYVTSEDSKKLAPLSPEARTCHICLQYKPERSHHCSACKKCIKKMDHHCHWLGRCINYDNHGHFIRFLFFMFLTSLSVFAFVLWYTYQFLNLEIHLNLYFTSGIILFLGLESLLLVIVSAFHLYNQLAMLVLNVTFIEALSCGTYGYSERDSPYNISLRHNIEEVLGPLKYCLLWKPSGDGLIFNKKYNVNYWPKYFQYSDNSYGEITV